MERLYVDGLFPDRVRWDFTTRRGGVSTGPYASLNLGWDVGDDPVSVRENHRRLGEALGYDAEKLATVRQVHGHRVHVLRRAAEGRALRGKQGDGIVLIPSTDSSAGEPEPEATDGARAEPLAALVRVADCCPVLVAARDRPAAAVLHCGWRSTVRGLIARTIACLAREAGAAPASLAAAIGPCIGPEAFEVGEEVAAAFAQKVSLDVVLRRPGRRKPHIDLQGAVRHLLIRAGIADERIETFRRCTVSEPDDFFSFRRDGHDGGRQAGLVVLLPVASGPRSPAG